VGRVDLERRGKRRLGARQLGALHADHAQLIVHFRDLVRVRVRVRARARLTIKS